MNSPIFKQFELHAGFCPSDQSWHIHVFSIGDKKVAVFKGSKFSPLIKRVTTALRKKEIVNRSFPMPTEPSRILVPGSDRIVSPESVRTLIVPNGR